MTPPVMSIAPLRNTVGKRDADEFLREARAFNDSRGWTRGVHLFDNNADMATRRLAVLEPLRTYRDLHTFAMFCHGWHHGIQAGFRNHNIPELAHELKAVAAKDLTVVLYCCSTGADGDGDQQDERIPGVGGDGGFADRLRDALCELGVRATVFAHSTPGHTTRNPWVRMFSPDERFGGRFLVERESPLWPAWLRSLHGGNMRFRFPYLTQEQLHAELATK